MPLIKTFSLKKKLKHSDPRTNFNSCTIHLLNDSHPSLVINLKNNLLGSSLLDEVDSNIGKLLEKDYFGLRYIDKYDQKHWLRLDKTVIKQLRRARTNLLYFSVKYYPADPLVDFVQELARYQLYLQLRKDLYSERLIVKDELLQKLIGLVIQAEVGDIPDATSECVLSSINILKICKNVSPNTLKKVSEILETLKGMETDEMERQFIQLLSQLESYGVEPNCVVDSDGNKLFLAMNHQGICTFVGEKRTSMHYWENISKMIYISKIFMIEINIDNNKRKLEFKFDTESAASAFWMWAMDRQYFMTLKTSTDAKKVKSNYNIFRKKINHRFSGRSKREVTESCQTLSTISQAPVIRTRNSIVISRSNSVRAILRDSMILDNEEINTTVYATMPRRSKANNPVSVISIDFQNGADGADGTEISDDSSNHNDSTISNNNFRIGPYGDDLLSELTLPDIDEDKVIEVIEPLKLSLEESTYPFIDILPEDAEIELQMTGDELRERMTESVSLEINAKEQALTTSVDSNDLIPDCSSLENEYRYQTTDGMFFVKFVVITTLILLVVMVTSLFAYYYYRSASIADLKKQKYSSEWNKNIDLEAIKRFVLRHDAP